MTRTTSGRFLLGAAAALLAALPALPQAPAEKAPLPPKAAADRLDGPPVVSAKAWAVADGATGKVLWGSGEADPLAIASTTKVMTAWVVLRLAADEPGVLDETVAVTERAAKTTGSGARIQSGEKYTVRDLLYGLLLPSGNDAAVALAEHFGRRFGKDADADPLGRFVAEMNRRTAALKLAETKYLDPHGLGKNLSSPRDLAALAAEGMKDPRFRRYVGTRRHECEATGPGGEKRAVTWDNTNRLLGIEGYDGVKTGTTTAAGSCLVASGRRGADHLILVVLGSTSNDGRYADARNLFAWAWRARGHTDTPAPWRPDPKLLADLEKRKTTWNFREEKVPELELPDPLAVGGERITTAAEWERKGRPATLDLFRTHVYGRPPEATAGVAFEVVATDPKAMDGTATLKRVKITSRGAGGKSFAFEAALLTPNAAKGPVPAFVLINNRGVDSADPTRKATAGFWPAEEIIARGYAAAVFRTNDVDADKKDDASRAGGVRGVWPAGGGKVGEDAWATLSAWAWGASRVMDYLVTDKAVDASKVAIVGHSRGGKTALWAGAQDERFALVVSNDSGCGGAALGRRPFGETVAAINRGFPHWFCGNFKKYDGREGELPVDQHQLMALVAPRGLYVASADADFWADQRGEFLALAHAAPVYALYKHPGLKADEMPPLDTPLVRGRVGYHVRRGVHNLTPYDWDRFMDFADRLWRGREPR